MAEEGCSLKVLESYLNGDLADLPEDAAQRILSLAIGKSADFSISMTIPLSDECFTVNANHVDRQEIRLIDLNFRKNGLKEMVRKLYNES